MLYAQFMTLALISTMLAVSGCGGSTKTQSSSNSAPKTVAETTAAPAPLAPDADVKLAHGTPLSREQLIAKGDAICAHLHAQQSSTVVKSPQEFARELIVTAGWERAAYVELKKLTPPASMAGEWKQFLGSMQDLASGTANLSGAQSGNPHTVKLFAAATKTHQNLVTVAKRNGFKVCSRA